MGLNKVLRILVFFEFDVVDCWEEEERISKFEGGIGCPGFKFDLRPLFGVLEPFVVCNIDIIPVAFCGGRPSIWENGVGLLVILDRFKCWPFGFRLNPAGLFTNPGGGNLCGGILLICNDLAL